jgi:hypothetical protein
MPKPAIVISQITKITATLIQLGLSHQQNFPSNQQGRIVYDGMQDISIAMKNIAYREIYKQLDESKNYNLKMLDGALIQMLYDFKGDELISHHLAFFPSPSLESYQNEPDIYEEDEIYADILTKNIVTFPIRFDYDPKHFEEIEHPKTHATLGQYKNCRIPVSEPLTPEIFITFILRNFYNTAFQKYTDKFSISNNRFDVSITNKEKYLLHFEISIK